LYKQDIVKSIILDLLGKCKIIDVNKCIIKEVDNNTAKIFLQNNHIQGSVDSEVKIGLYYNGDLYSLMVFGKSTNEKIELLRFCNKLGINVIDGAYKLFSYYKNNYNIQEIISYVDRSWFSGCLYNNLGFKLEKEIKPNYYYINGGIRENSLNYCISKLIKDGYDKNKTEKEIMFERGIYRIYDSGSLKFINT